MFTREEMLELCLKERQEAIENLHRFGTGEPQENKAYLELVRAVKSLLR